MQKCHVCKGVGYVDVSPDSWDQNICGACLGFGFVVTEEQGSLSLAITPEPESFTKPVTDDGRDVARKKPA